MPFDSDRTPPDDHDRGVRRRFVHARRTSQQSPADPVYFMWGVLIGLVIIGLIAGAV
jgi:hypothetical protein